MTQIIPLVIFATFFNAMGQILFKKASNDCGTTHLSGTQSYFDFFKKVSAMPWIWLGFGLIGMGLLVWLLAISQADLSFVYPIGSLYYIFIFVLSRVFLGEEISPLKFVGALIIGAGILLITRS